MLEPARMAGELSGITDVGLLKMALQSSRGSAHSRIGDHRRLPAKKRRGAEAERALAAARDW